MLHHINERVFKEGFYTIEKNRTVTDPKKFTREIIDDVTMANVFPLD